MSRFLLPTTIAGAMTAVALIFAAYADGMPAATGSAAQAIHPVAQAAPAAGCPTVAGATTVTTAPAQQMASDADAASTAALPPADEPPPQLAERWRNDFTGWFGEIARDLSIEFRYPPDVESEPDNRSHGLGPSDEA